MPTARPAKPADRPDPAAPKEGTPAARRTPNPDMQPEDAGTPDSGVPQGRVGTVEPAPTGKSDGKAGGSQGRDGRI